jgi:hypothetical protein
MKFQINKFTGEIYNLTDSDKKLIRVGDILLEQHPERPFLFNAKWPDGTVKIIKASEITKMLIEDSKLEV